jgi:hypothetical protein
VQINNTIKAQMQIPIFGGDMSESIWWEMMKMMKVAILDSSLQTFRDKKKNISFEAH